MAERINADFDSENGATAARMVLEVSLNAVGDSEILIEKSKNTLEINIRDKSSAKEKAAVYGAKRLCRMLERIDKSIK